MTEMTTKPKIPKVCSVGDCNRTVNARGLCHAHYLKQWKVARGIIQSPRLKHGQSDTKQYRVWTTMLNRCHTKSSRDYRYYGARGITVCDRWRGVDGYSNFLKDMGNRPTDKHSIDRIDNDGNYEPSNCRWATSQVQKINRRRLRNNTSGYTGVAKRNQSSYYAYIMIDRKPISLGSFKTLEDAIDARKAGEERYFKPILEAA